MAPHVGLDKISNNENYWNLETLSHMLCFTRLAIHKNYASFEIWPKMLALTRLAILLNGFQNFGMNVDKITPLIIEFYHNEDSS